jgi:hypothetical protein
VFDKATSSVGAEQQHAFIEIGDSRYDHLGIQRLAAIGARNLATLRPLQKLRLVGCENVLRSGYRGNILSLQKVTCLRVFDFHKLV